MFNTDNCSQRNIANCLSFNANTRQVFVNQVEIDLTGLEFNLLQLFVLHYPELLARSTIEYTLFQCTENTNHSINMHISNLRKKLTSASRNLFIKSVRGRGYFLQVIDDKS